MATWPNTSYQRIIIVYLISSIQFTDWLFNNATQKQPIYDTAGNITT